MAASRSRHSESPRWLEAVRGAGCARVAAVGEVEDRELLAVQERHDVHGVFPGGAQAVHGDHPGVAGAGHEPGGQRRRVRRGSSTSSWSRPSALPRVADVELRGEPDPVARLQGAVGDALQAAYDGVGGVRDGVEDGADDRVDAVARRGRTCRGAGRRGCGSG